MVSVLDTRRNLNTWTFGFLLLRTMNRSVALKEQKTGHVKYSFPVEVFPEGLLTHFLKLPRI